MRRLKIVVSKETLDFKAYISENFEDIQAEFFNVDSKGFTAARDANKIVHDYAVTQLPFVLLVDDTLPEDKQEYAAVYSEEGPITVDRINAKL